MTNGNVTVPIAGESVQAGSALAAVTALVSNTDPDSRLEWPPGCLGETARFIYNSAPRPVREVAIVAALGLHAGILGRSWQIGDSGLNLYVVLVAPSAIGKEAMHSGIAKLIRVMTQRYPLAAQFVDFSDFASGPALVKGVAANPCFVNVAGEWGHKLRQLAEDKRGTNPAMQSLRKEMTNLYSKSGPTAVMGGIRYSNASGNIESVAGGAAYSMIGETTPATFYSALTTSMMADGFMSRLCIVEYTGARPPLNTSRLNEPSQELTNWLTGLTWHSATLGSKNEFRQIALNLDAEELASDFESECDRHINSTRDESYRQAWNRAALKVMRICGLLAASDNPTDPCVNFEHIEWALMLIRRDIATFMRRWDAGDIGDADDDHKRRVKLMDVLHRAFTPTAWSNADERTRKMLQCCVMPMKYLLPRLSNQTAFTSHRLGQNEAIKLTLRNLCDAGVLAEVIPPVLERDFNYRGKAYRLIDPSL